MASSLTKPILLNNGKLMPKLGLGTYLILGESCQEIVKRAINIGYRLIDTAYSYGNEKDIGAAVKAEERAGNIKRDQLFITTKVPPALLAPREITRCIEESRENLKLQYIDLVLIHSPWGLKYRDDGVLKSVGKDGMYEYDDHNLIEAWSVFEKAVKDGHVKSIGLSNFTAKQIDSIVNNCKIKPQNVQFECHAYYQQKLLQQFCTSRGIVCTSYGPIGAPGMPSHHQTPGITDSFKLLEDEIVQKMAEKYDRTPAQILLRFLIQRSFIVIPKTSNVKRLEENITLFDFEISCSDMHVLSKLDRGVRFFNFIPYSKHPSFPEENEPY